MRYWSCSKFADWLRGTPKPLAETFKGWEDWEAKAKIKKLRYWLAEEGLDYLEDFIFWPFNFIREIKFYFNNRFISRTHTLTSKLKKGDWHEFDERILNCLFDELVNFVEVELAWMYISHSKEKQKRYKAPWYRRKFNFKGWHSSEAGVDYLVCASELKFDEEFVSKEDPKYGKPTPQAVAAMEILRLYNWWKFFRLNRIDPSEASGWSEYCRKGSIDSPLDDEGRKILEICNQMEQKQDDEDTEMLIRLIKIRHELWS